MTKNNFLLHTKNLFNFLFLANIFKSIVKRETHQTNWSSSMDTMFVYDAHVATEDASCDAHWYSEWAVPPQPYTYQDRRTVCSDTFLTSTL